MKSDGKRAVRVAERVREELASLLMHEVRDPRVQGVVVSRVSMTDDLRIVNVGVRSLVAEDGPSRDNLLEGLRHASSLLRREVTRRAGLRYAPEFRFSFDEGQDRATAIERVLEEIRVDDQRRK
jgi:ribosome-binding factor A